MIDVDCLRAVIPACLLDLLQWVNWKYVTRSGKPTKVPINPRTGQPASSTDAGTWGSFEQAIAGFQNIAAVDGVGFVFTENDRFCGIDLDGAIIDAQIVPEAQAIIDRFNTYTEISPSGRGVKLFLRGSKPAGAGCRKDHVEGFDHVEVYDTKRFFTVTGNHVANTPLAVEDRQAQLDAFCNALWPPKATSTRVPVAHHHHQSVDDSAAEVAPHIDMAERERRCRAYVEKCPDAISGQGGHNATLRAACECYRFGLDEATAWVVMQWFNDQKTGGELDRQCHGAR